MATQADRLQQLRHELRQQGRIATTEASVRLGVTPITLRRDIIALEGEGVAIRVHGGAIAPTSRSFEPPLAERLHHHRELKAALARRALQHIRPGMNVALDFGTRIQALAKELRENPVNAVIASSSLEAARALAADPHYRVMTPGGWVGAGDLNFYGSDTEAFFSRHRWDICVLTVAGIDADTSRFGVRRAVYGMLGAVASDIVLVSAVAVGLGAVLLASELWFSVAKWIGVGYLAYLGLRLLLSKGRFTPHDTRDVQASRRAVFMKSFLVSVTNPKGYLFVGALLPQFITPVGSQLTQYLIIGTVFCLLDFSVMFAYAAAGSQVMRLLKRRGALWLDRICGAVLLILAGVLAFTRRAAA